MEPPDHEAPWWAGGVVGPRPGDDRRRRAGRFSAKDPRWRFENRRDFTVVLDVLAYEPYLVESGRVVAFFSPTGAALAVADPERAGVVLESGPVEELAVPDS